MFENCRTLFPVLSDMVKPKYRTLPHRFKCNHLCNTSQTMLEGHSVRQKMQYLIHFHVFCIALTLALITIPAEGVSYDFTDSPGKSVVNLSDIIVSLTELTSQMPHNGSATETTTVRVTRRKYLVEKAVADDVPRDSPAALVIASSIAAVSILVFFVIAYLWHTHQLDSRARKLAIRLAADAETGLRRSRGPPTTKKYPRAIPKEKARRVSESSEDQNHYVILPPDEERGASTVTGRNSLGASGSETGDNEDSFEQIKLPPLGERGKIGARVDPGAHRKWNRSRKSMSGASLDKRGSAITDKEVLSHFASRRHSTFFI